MGTDDLAGIIEILGPHVKPGDLLASEFLDKRTIWEWPLSGTLIAADFVSTVASGFGVTNELCAMTPYEIPQAWATALQQAGFQAVRYRTRFDTGEKARGIAHFDHAGDAGVRAGEQSHAIDASVRSRLESEFGLKVAPRPLLGELDLAPPP
jgi:hypothetical protein